MIRKSHLMWSLFARLWLGAVLTSAAFGQTAIRPKLTISNISLGAIPDGYYNANVNLTLERTNNPQVNFNAYFPHVKSLDELCTKLRPAVDNLADELKHAEIVVPH